jgi:FkbM family methyltransferase
MAPKQAILNLIEHPLLGALIRPLGRLTYRRPRLFGLINPFHIPAFVTEQDSNQFITYGNSYLDLSSSLRGAIKFSPHLFEPEISYIIGKLIQPEDIVLDVGANVGFHTIAAARAATEGRVYAFEPVSEMAERLSENCALNNVDNVTIIPCALGAKNETLPMAVNIAGAGMEGTNSLANSLHISHRPDHYTRRDVAVRRLDELVEELGIEDRIGFVKIDTEGFETHVIEGGLETLRKHRPAMIVEAHTNRLEEAGKSFGWYLETFPDYHIFIVYGISRTNPYLSLAPLTPDQPEIAINLLLLPKQAPYKLS